jgi:hypothetical protein
MSRSVEVEAVGCLAERHGGRVQGMVPDLLRPEVFRIHRRGWWILHSF